MPHKNIHFAKALRANQTDAELKIWQALRAGCLMGFKFKRQVPIGDFIVDFVCFEQKLIVELDGGQHMDSEKDVMRDARLNAMGFRVLRFWNNEVMQNIEGVLVVILQYLQIVAPSPQPSPTRGEGVVIIEATDKIDSPQPSGEKTKQPTRSLKYTDQVVANPTRGEGV